MLFFQKLLIKIMLFCKWKQYDTASEKIILKTIIRMSLILKKWEWLLSSILLVIYFMFPGNVYDSIAPPIAQPPPPRLNWPLH
jgi:hypothetical protein